MMLLVSGLIIVVVLAAWFAYYWYANYHAGQESGSGESGLKKLGGLIKQLCCTG